MRKRLLSLARIAVSVGLLAWLLATVGLEETIERLTVADPLWLLVAMALFALGVALRSVRWKALLEGVGARVGFWRLLQLYLVGFFFSKLLPSGIAGDIVRGVEVTHDDTTASQAAGTVVVDRLTGLLVLFALALVAWPFSIQLVGLRLAVALALIPLAGVVAGWFLWQERWVRALASLWPRRLRFRFLDGLAETYEVILACRGTPLRRALLISLGVNVTVIGLNYAAARALGIDVSVGYFLLFVPLISLSLVLPVSWGGLGLREAVTILLFAQAGVERSAALAMSLMVYVINMIYSLIGGVIYLAMGVSSLKPNQDPPRG